MAFLSASAQSSGMRPAKAKLSFSQSQALARQKGYEKKAPKYKVKLGDLTGFTVAIVMETP